MSIPHYDVIIIGAGISGISSARRLSKSCPDRSFVILEGRANLGGTWDLFRYPGVRSDSDMFTMSFEDKPWHADNNVASPGAAILEYLNEAADEKGLRPKIRFGHKVKSISWSTEKAIWTINAEANGQTVQMTCGLVHACSGYYSYQKGYTPEIPGLNEFQGEVIHPQQWPKNFQADGKNIVVIGSGATAVTIVPELAKTAKHVIMLQRSPTYVVAWPSTDGLARVINSVLPKALAYKFIRFKNIHLQRFIFKVGRRYPVQFKRYLMNQIRKNLGPRTDHQEHFNPRYAPWDQRLCLVPDGDLFTAIRDLKVTVVTGEIEKVEAKGVRLKSGQTIVADTVVTATGLQLQALGGMNVEVDGSPIDLTKTYLYKGLMLSDVPNLIFTFGYINASWTLRAELISEYVSRLLNHMHSQKFKICIPKLRPQDRGMKTRLMVEEFDSGYLKRSIHQFPRLGDREPWISPPNYMRDRKTIRNSPIPDDVLHFT